MKKNSLVSYAYVKSIDSKEALPVVLGKKIAMHRNLGVVEYLPQ